MTWALRPTTRAPTSSASSSKWALSGSVRTTWSAPHGQPPRPGGRAGPARSPGSREEALDGGHRGQPDDPGTDHQHRLTVARWGAQQSVAGDRDRLVQAGHRSDTASGIGCSIEAWASTCSRPSAAQVRVNPSVRPLLTIRLSRLRHDDVQPRAQLAHGGSMPRARHGMHGSTATRVPTGQGHSGPASITRPAISWPEDERERAHRCQGGRRARVVGEQVEIAPADPAGGHRHAGPCPDRVARAREGRPATPGKAGSAMSNWMARTRPA